MFYCYVKLYFLTCLNTMKHWRHWARAVLAVIPSQIQRFPNFQVHVAEPAFLLRFLWLFGFHVFFSRTTIAHWAAVVCFYINRNAAFWKSLHLTVSDSTVDLVAVFIFQHWCFVVKVFRAKTFVAIVLRVNSFTFVVLSPLKLTCC